MSRLIKAQIAPPVLDAQRRPLFFTYDRTRYRVAQVLDSWKETGEWWEGEKESTVWRLLTAKGGVVELYQYPDQWVLYRMLD